MTPSFDDTIALLWAKSNNRTRSQFEYDVTLFLCFCLIPFIYMTGVVVVP